MRFRRPLVLMSLPIAALSATGCGTSRTTPTGGAGSAAVADADATRAMLSERAATFFAALRDGTPISVADEWDLESLREKAFGETWNLLEDEGRAKVEAALPAKLTAIFGSAAFKERLAGAEILKTEVDRQDAESFWVLLSLDLGGQGGGDLQLFAKEVDGQWRWTDIGRVGFLLSDELETMRAVADKPLDEFVESLDQEASKLAVILPPPPISQTPPSP
ncbi:MAG TPA: hypothetical protein PLI18_08880 [Pirellulaceae bacterium]|nr:hypothetical protein [Pirellulaceae bacterium]